MATTGAATTQPNASSIGVGTRRSGRAGSEDEGLGLPESDHAPTSSMSWSHTVQSVPPDHVSRFQIGTVRFSVSMQ